MIRNYWTVLSEWPYFFLFSLASIFFSAPGQTFLISLTIPFICDRLTISPLAFATIYSLGTLFASFCLPLIGRMIDTLRPPAMLAINAVSLSLSIALYAVTPYSIGLFIAILGMRLFGQGALTLTATSYTIKRFHDTRGLALSVTQLGYPLSEMAFPLLFTACMTVMTLKGTYLTFGAMILLLYLPITIFGITSTKTQPIPNETEPSVTVQDTLKDPFFPIYIIISAIPPIMMTAALYFQITIFSFHSWPIAHISWAIFCYAVSKFITTIIVGPLVDRMGPIIPLIALTLSIGLATCLIGVSGALPMAYVYYALYGVGIGASATTISYLWGLLYGAKHIGQIKGIIAIVRNGGTALAPVLFSWLFYHWNVSLPKAFIISGIMIIAIGLSPIILKRLDPRLSANSINKPLI